MVLGEEGVVVQGAKHPIHFDIEDTGESLHNYFKSFLDTMSTSDDLTSKVKEVIVSHSRPIRFHFISRNAYAKYRGIKIPTKGLYNQSKNKFTSKAVKKALPKPMNVSLSKNTNDKHSFNLDIVFKMVE